MKTNIFELGGVKCRDCGGKVYFDITKPASWIPENYYTFCKCGETTPEGTPPDIFDKPTGEAPPNQPF